MPTPPAQPAQRGMTYRQAQHWQRRLYAVGYHQTELAPILHEDGRHIRAYEIALTRAGRPVVSIDSTDLARSYVAEPRP